ncbi:MAG: hypothetical protein AB7M12_02785 [Hyphomonadaceae bacterium]
MFKHGLMVMLAAAALSACAGRQRPPPPTAPGMAPGGAPAFSHLIAPDALVFLDFDANRDRQITRAEFDQGVAAAWAALAKGQDSIGHIDLQDWVSAELGGENFDFGPIGFDTNYDGRINRDEFIAALAKRFDTLDKDKNGVLTRAEFVRTGPTMRQGGEGPAGMERPMMRRRGP